MAGDVIIEFIRFGNSVKVCAVCTKTGREVNVVGDPRAPKAQLEKLAINKLRYVMQKEAAQSKGPNKGIVI